MRTGDERHGAGDRDARDDVPAPELLDYAGPRRHHAPLVDIGAMFRELAWPKAPVCPGKARSTPQAPAHRGCRARAAC